MKAADTADPTNPSPSTRQARSETKNFRQLRRRLTSNMVSLAVRAAPWVPAALIDLAESCAIRLGPHFPILAKTIEANMRSVGLYSPEGLRRHFALVARHFTNGARLFAMAKKPRDVQALAHREIEIDDSISHVRDSLTKSGGAVLCAAHSCNYLVSLSRLREEVPVCVYLRWSRDPRKVQIKRDWCQAAGLDVIVEPGNATDPTSRAAACVEALRSGRVLVITPDIAQKVMEGAAVTILSRSAFIPSGPASLAMLAEVPMIPLFGRNEDNRHVVYFETPIVVRSRPRADGGRQAALQEAMQAWADGMSRFLTSNPESWFMWGDSRWTRVFHGDPEYTTSSKTNPLSPTDTRDGATQPS